MRVTLTAEYYMDSVPQEDFFWRIVEMECLPPVGAELWTTSDEAHLIVKKIVWWETGIPTQYTIECHDCDNRPHRFEEQEDVDRLISLGWKLGGYPDPPEPNYPKD